MKLTITIVLLILFAACDYSKPEQAITPNYPESLVKVFDAHGGLSNWQNMNALSYKIIKSDMTEVQKVDLKNRREYIAGNNFTMGYDGTNIWLEADTTYKGNPIFYKNLMFYFYAMPFVLADDGIIYSDVKPLIFEGKTYPGIKIGYKDGVGVSSKDEYIIHYDEETYQMTWLAYTVTFKTQEKSERFKWIRYDDWKEFNGAVLPNSMTWYNVEEGLPTTLRNTRLFEEVQLMNRPFSDDVFVMTDGAKIVK